VFNLVESLPYVFIWFFGMTNGFDILREILIKYVSSAATLTGVCMCKVVCFCIFTRK